MVDEARTLLHEGKESDDIVTELMNRISEVRTSIGVVGAVPERFRASVKTLVLALSGEKDLNEVLEVKRRSALELLKRKKPVSPTPPVSLIVREVPVASAPASYYPTPVIFEEPHERLPKHEQFEAKIKSLLQDFYYSDRIAIGPDNPRHLAGFVEQLQDQHTRADLLETLYRDFSPQGPQPVPICFRERTLQEVFDQATADELVSFFELLNELKEEGVMSRYDFDRLSLTEDCQIKDPYQYQLKHRQQLQALRDEDTQRILELAGVHDLAELGAFDVPFGLQTSLVAEGIIVGHPTFAAHDADIVTANLRILRLVFEKGWIQKRSLSHDYRVARVFLFYRRERHNEYPQQLRDLTAISHNGEMWPYSQYRMQKFVSS